MWSHVGTSEFFVRGFVYVGVQSTLVRLIAERRVAGAVVCSGVLSTIWLANAGRTKAPGWRDCFTYGTGAALATALVLWL